MEQDGGLSVVPLDIFPYVVELYETLFFGLIAMFVQPRRRPMTYNCSIVVVIRDGKRIFESKIVMHDYFSRRHP